VVLLGNLIRLGVLLEKAKNECIKLGAINTTISKKAER
jgi:hypothetical protein